MEYNPFRALDHVFFIQRGVALDRGRSHGNEFTWRLDQKRFTCLRNMIRYEAVRT